MSKASISATDVRLHRVGENGTDGLLVLAYHKYIVSQIDIMSSRKNKPKGRERFFGYPSASAVTGGAIPGKVFLAMLNEGRVCRR